MYLNFPWVHTTRPLDTAALTLVPEEWHHVRQVLRCALEDPIVVFNGAGQIRLGCLGRREINFTAPVQTIARGAPRVNCVLFLPNNITTFEICLRKACELGVATIQPVLGDRTEGHAWSAPLWAKRQPRFQRIMIESCKQAKNPWLPQLRTPIKSDTLVSSVLGVCFYGSLSTISQSLPAPTALTGFSGIIGPEGGFSSNEESFLNKFSTPIHLPTYVLRVETAMVSLISVLKIRYIPQE